MKGIIFAMFSQYVEDEFGLDTLDEIYENTPLESKGIYTSLKSYPDTELVTLLQALSQRKNIPLQQILFDVGKKMIQVTAVEYPQFYQGKTLRTFLKSVDEIIHSEVHKLFPNADTPSFKVEEIKESHLRMVYQSHRKLCRLAEGLITGASEYFQTPVNLSQSACHHKGDSVCQIEVEFING